MKQFVLLITLFMIACICNSCTTMQGRWEKAAQADTIASYKSFLSDDNPNEEYASKAHLRIKELESRQQEKEEEACFEYARTQKATSWDDQWQERRLEDYLKKYPSGKYAAEANKMLEQSVFKRAEKQQYPYVYYMNFISRFPNSDLAPEATARARKIRYDTVRKSGSVAYYENFIQDYPQGPDTRALENDLPKLRQLEKAANQAKELGQIALKMAPVIMAKTRVLPNGLIEQTPPFKVTSPNDLKYQMDEFRRLLKSGADPGLVRIRNFRPHYVYPNGFTTSFGQPGEVVPEKDGGITLLEYFELIELKEAADLIKKQTSK